MCLLQAVFAIISHSRSNISSCILYLHSTSSPHHTVFAATIVHATFLIYSYHSLSPKSNSLFLRSVEASFQNFCGSASFPRNLHPRNFSLRSKNHMCRTFFELCLTESNLHFLNEIWALFSQR